MPRVSVIIPTYNRAHLVERAIDSVLTQDFADFEIIVVDDGSTDETPIKLSRYGDSRICYLRKENGGLASARNAGIAQAHGEYIAFLDDDDTFLPTKLSLQAQLLDVRPEIGVVAGGWLFVDEASGRTTKVFPWEFQGNLDLKAWLFASLFPVHAALVRRQWLQEVGGFDQAFPRLEDWDLWLRLAYAGCPMRWSEALVCCYHFHETNMVRDAVSQKQWYLAVLDKFFGQDSLPIEIQEMRNAAYAWSYLSGSCLEYGAGAVDLAKQDMARAIHLDPTLMTRQESGLFDAVLGWARHPVIGPDPIAFINVVLNNLPEEAAGLERQRRRALGRLHMAEFFHKAREHNWPAVRRAFIRGVSNDPRWLKNRGVISIALEAFLGSKSAQQLRVLTRVLGNVSPVEVS